MMLGLSSKILTAPGHTRPHLANPRHSCHTIAERAGLDERLTEIEKRIAEWERVRSSIQGNGAPRTRAKKGENDRKIAEFYAAHPGEGFTLPELAEKTGISWSSCRNVVTKNQKSKYDDRDGKWFRKGE